MFSYIYYSVYCIPFPLKIRRKLSRDIVKQWKKGPFFAILTCESQDKIHYAMPVRNLLQDGLTYTEQIRKLWKETEYKRVKAPSAPRLTGEEYLSRFRKHDRIFPVITLVFYYDLKNWDGAVDMCQALEDIYADGVKEGEKTGIQEGRTREKLSIIAKMVQDNLPVSTIRKYTNATDEEIKTARELIKSSSVHLS